MANPLTSPWLKALHGTSIIHDKQLYRRWYAIKLNLYKVPLPTIIEYNGLLKINSNIYIAKHKSKMRLKSHIDWCWYTPKTLADAIDNNIVEEYYEIMLKDMRSDPNLWKDKDLEMEIKTYYAVRVGRASLI